MKRWVRGLIELVIGMCLIFIPDWVYSEYCVFDYMISSQMYCNVMAPLIIFGFVLAILGIFNMFIISDKEKEKS